jgi:hypothetical protein
MVCADRFMAEHQTMQQQDLRHIPQAEFHSKPPQHGQKDHIGLQMKPFQHRFGPLIETLPAASTPETPIAMRCPVLALRRFGRTAMRIWNSSSLLI